MKIIQIGNGNVAKMHRECFTRESMVIAVIETNPAKLKRAKEEGFSAFPDIASLPLRLMEEADLWDICAPDENHYPMMKKILEMGFKKILVEKPICQPSQIQAMRKLLANFPNAKICVEETYASSQVVATIREMCEKYRIFHPKILMEQSKNRMQDIVNGRFVDKELGVFALEVPHSFTAVTATGIKRLPSVIQSVLLDDMKLPSGEILPRQGKGRIAYITEDGCEVIILSAMDGNILHPLPEINAPATIPFGSPVRYRIIVIEEDPYKIIGQFEPIPGWPRFIGRVLVYSKGVLRDEFKIEDKSMNQHIAKAVRYFRGEEKNPAPPLEALSLVIFLNKVIQRLGP
ncbi:MAG: Gfo/Idh/MocA family oxidoreductase [Candidatus Nealsonbacteria bacterium]